MGFFKPTLNSKHDHLSLIVLGAGAFALGLTICRLWMNRPDFEQHKAPSNSENPPHEDEHDNDHEDDHERLRLSSAPLTPIRGREYSLLDDFPLPPSSSTIDELAKPASLNGHSSHLLQQEEQQQEYQQQTPSSTSQSTIPSPTSPFTPPSHSPSSSAEEEQQKQEQNQNQNQNPQQTQQEKFNWTNFSQNENLLPTPPPPFSSSSSSSSSPHFSPSPSSPSSSSSSSSPPSPKRKQTHQTHQNPSSSPNFFSGTSAWPRELPRRMIVPPELTTTTATNEQPFIFRGMASSLSSLLQEEKEGSCGGSGGEKD
ncbi:uncharacterized protein SEPMUDRAFT_106499 [Sphaerulina musiva SO2202]|uniref:Uncharacterized protein n=1 Tax=Sphaerulina musiva (strain SO2202) TaxID=692275 RepID=M3C1F0_SPHMS|nr:uncharacterized protein SEPMUDRAFT_106499 [Sphaerulina musiva SO2202]EMF14131.1 hypothetical protein SEPMUDRAFT_106499 [Sphaerulina musiva SO2202]